jgi:hypothetical protein
MPTHFSLERLAEFLASEGIEFDHDDEEQVIQFAVEGDGGVHEVFFDLDQISGMLMCAVRPPVEVTPESLPLVYEATTRANHLLSLGGFQVNSDDCFIMFVLGVPIEDGDLSLAQMEQVLGTALECSDLYQQAFADIVAGRATVAQAIAAAESEPEGEV